jgi:hypothetical protein
MSDIPYEIDDLIGKNSMQVNCNVNYAVKYLFIDLNHNKQLFSFSFEKKTTKLSSISNIFTSRKICLPNKSSKN